MWDLLFWKQLPDVLFSLQIVLDCCSRDVRRDTQHPVKAVGWRHFSSQSGASPSLSHSKDGQRWPGDNHQTPPGWFSTNAGFSLSKCTKICGKSWPAPVWQTDEETRGQKMMNRLNAKGRQKLSEYIQSTLVCWVGYHHQLLSFFQHPLVVTFLTVALTCLKSHTCLMFEKKRWQQSATWFSAISRLQCWSVHVVVLSESEYSPTWRSECVLTAAACSTTDAAGQKKKQQNENPLINFLFLKLLPVFTISSQFTWKLKG